MRQPHRSRAVAIPAASVLPIVIRTLLAFIATAILLFIFSPSVVQAHVHMPAQAATQAGTVATPVISTHRVQSGESLWSIAARFYGDGHKWRDLAKLNGLSEGGEKSLVVGQALKVPKLSATEVKRPTSSAPPTGTPKAATTVASEAPAAAAGKGALAAQTAGKPDAEAKAPARTASKTPPVTSATSAERKAEARPSPVKVVETNPEPNAARRSALNAEEISSTKPHIWSVDVASQKSARGRDVPTVFLGFTYEPTETANAVRAAITVDKPRERAGEYETAPYAVDAARLEQVGFVGKPATKGSSQPSSEQLFLTDETEITLPSGTAAVVGARYVSVIQGPLVKTGVRMAVPTGVLEIVRANTGAPVVARVRRQSGRIEPGQRLLPVEGAAPSATVRAVPVTDNTSPVSTQVVWIENDVLLPSLQSFLLLSAGEREGVKAGDEFALIAPLGTGANLREQRIAVVRVVRVTGLGSTAVVVKQEEPSIAVGGWARRIAQMR